MSTEIEEGRQAASAVCQGLTATLRGYTAADWGKPSDCQGWSVANVTSHLIQVADLLGDSIARGIDGDAGPPALAASAGVAAWRAARAGRNAELAALPGAELLDLFQAAAATIDRAFDGIVDAPAEAQAWHPAGAQPLAWFVDHWLFEIALHDWDIRVASDAGAEIRPDCLAAFAKTLPARLPRGFAGANDPNLAGRYRVEFVEPEQFAWVTSLYGDGSTDTSLTDGWATDVGIRTDPGAFALVMTNRRPARQFRDQNRWVTHGNSQKALAFSESFGSH